MKVINGYLDIAYIVYIHKLQLYLGLYKLYTLKEFT